MGQSFNKIYFCHFNKNFCKNLFIEKSYLKNLQCVKLMTGKKAKVFFQTIKCFLQLYTHKNVRYGCDSKTNITNILNKIENK